MTLLLLPLGAALLTVALVAALLSLTGGRRLMIGRPTTKTTTTTATETR